MTEVSQVAEGGRLPIGEVLSGLSIHGFEENEKPTWVFVLCKIESEGEEGWSFRTSAAPNREELLGALEVQVARLRRDLLAEWE